MKKIKIVKLNRRNFKQAIKLQETLFPEESGAMDITLASEGKTAENYCLLNYWLAVFNNQVVGIVGLYSYKIYPKDAWLGWFGVDKNYRKLGIGSKLFDFAYKKTKKLGFNTLRLYTDDISNANAIPFYQKKGMISEPYTNKQDEWVSEGNTLIFSKSLNSLPLESWNNKYLALKEHESLNQHQSQKE